MGDDILTFSSKNQGLVSKSHLPLDDNQEIVSLRPESFDDYVGQKEAVETLKIVLPVWGKPLSHISLPMKWGVS